MAAAAASLLLGSVSTWFAAVDRSVTEPYLDEVFHVRQAQHYCNNRFDIWDPKITTPPGIYLISYLLTPVLGCSITALRLANVLCLLALLVVVYLTYRVRRRASQETGFVSGIATLHSALNVALFPPLFFFSALYYTDVASTLSVVSCYLYFIQNSPDKDDGLVQVVIKVLLGLTSLTFRQTNIFWVAIAPAGLTLVVELDRGSRLVKESMYRRAEGFGDTTWSVIKASWRYDAIYDPPMRDVYFEDYLRTLVSIAVCSIKVLTQPTRVLELLRALSPYLSILACFVTFIFWNGSVVLGDKSNHVATINLPQMLYFWPYVVFFSWPLVLPQLLLIPVMFLAQLSRLAHLEPLIFFRRRYFLPRLWLVIALTILACIVVHFNTIVHPFMLADNRHYTFYVFRRLLRPGWVRYAVTPIYVLTGWACLECRGETPSTDIGVVARESIDVKKAAAAAQQDPKPSTSAKSSAEQSTDRRPTEHKTSKRPLRLADGKSSATVSFFLVTLITITLQLCTAPLVEPRYCILPWLVWRVHLPLHAIDKPRRSSTVGDITPIAQRLGEEAMRTSTSSASSKGGRDSPPTSSTSALYKFLSAYDYRLPLETAWFLLLNLITGYIFLNWTFTWLSEPLNKQRFMW